MQYVNNKGADQPAHPRSLISAFVVRCLDSIIPLLAIAEISRLKLGSVAEQAGSSLTWSKTKNIGFLVTWLKFDDSFPWESRVIIDWQIDNEQSDTLKIKHLPNLTGQPLSVFAVRDNWILGMVYLTKCIFS